MLQRNAFGVSPKALHPRILPQGRRLRQRRHHCRAPEKALTSVQAQPNTVPTRAILKLYLADQLSLSSTARQLGIKRHVVEREIKRTGHKLRPMGEAVRSSKIGRPRLKLSLRDPNRDPVDRWKIVELKIAGKSNREIAKLLHRAQPSIYLALRRMGFPDGTGVSTCYSFGELFDRAALRRLHGISGFNVTSLAKELGVPFGTLEAALSTRKSQKQLRFETARKASEWRKSLFRRLMSNASRHPGRQNEKYGQSRVIVTFFPDLRERYFFLLSALRQLGKKLRDNPKWSRDQLQQHLWQQATAEKAGRSPGDLFTRFLRWAPELMPFLAGKLQDLRGIRYQRIAWEILAGSLGTTAPIISAVVNSAQAQTIRAIPPEEMCWLIRKLAGESTLAQQVQQKPKHKSERKKGMTPETLEDGRLLEQYIRDFEKKNGTKRGALKYAARKVYGTTVDEHTAVQRGNKTLTRYRKALRFKNAGRKAA